MAWRYGLGDQRPNEVYKNEKTKDEDYGFKIKLGFDI